MSINHTASTHVALFYIICAFFLEKGNNCRNKCKSAIYRNTLGRFAKHLC